ncbi:Predicted membrane protein [Phaffia rhodozyma]|uniref:Predicted membrane protein n=1 Tax=Phaffia rhodozyma TaxID=264483 RepID=A0A0F7SMH0_PHARH|nr:Predicted membrane protein [Phaffia rhodozyma]
MPHTAHYPTGLARPFPVDLRSPSHTRHAPFARDPLAHTLTPRTSFSSTSLETLPNSLPGRTLRTASPDSSSSSLSSPPDDHRAPPAAYSSLPPSPTRSFADLDESPRKLDTLDLSILQRRFSTQPTLVHDHDTIQDQNQDQDQPHEDAELAPDDTLEHQPVHQEPQPKASLWEHLQEEIWANDYESSQELKWERVSNFIQVPLAIEKLITFGSLVCLDSFLYVFTILPIRSFIALCVLLENYWSALVKRKPRRHLAPTQRIDIIKFLLVLFSCVILIWGTDASYIYHSIRGQDSIKLVVIFGAFEIADKLCCAFGQDVLDSLFARETLSRRPNGSQPHFRPVFFFCLSLGCVVAHTLVFLFQLISLNVAINSFDNALLTLLVSNQFVEIKGSVFKKFEKENLFQIACADIVERFQLGLMLAIIAFRNLVELSGSDFSSLPRSFMKGASHVEAILSPALVVLGSEMVVDWLKHAYITKFNHIRVSTYERFADVLCRDLVTAGIGGLPSGKKHALADQSPLVSRRLGFASLPLACLVIRIAFQALGMASRHKELTVSSAFLHGISTAEGDGSTEEPFWESDAVLWLGIGFGMFIFWICLVVLKIILGINLLKYASRRFVGMESRREQDDELNRLGRSPLGEGAQEKSYNKELSSLLRQNRDDLPLLADLPRNATPFPSSSSFSTTERSFTPGDAESPAGPGARSTASGSTPGAGSSTGGKKKGYQLEEVTRYTMVKRIF